MHPVGSFAQYMQPQRALSEPHMYAGGLPALPFPGYLPTAEMMHEIVDMKTCASSALARHTAC